MFQGKYEENDNSAHKGVFWKYSRISRISEVNRDTGYYFSEVDLKTVRRFRNNISNPDKFVGEPPHLEAQPPFAVANIISIFHLISLFNYCFYLYLLS